MTAPQHNAKPIAKQPEAALEESNPLDNQPMSASTKRTFTDNQLEAQAPASASANRETPYANNLAAKRIQRSWLIALGLLGSSGFVANQMSFALAESDFLIDDRAAVPAVATDSPSVADTTFTYTESTFSPAPLPSPVEYAPPTAAPAIESYVPSPTPAPDWVAEYQRPVPAPVAKAPAPVETVAAPSIEIAPPTAPNRAARLRSQPAQSTAQTSAIQPTVSAVAPPTFSSVRKPKKKLGKVARHSSPLRGLAEASVTTMPLSSYAAGLMALAPSMVQMSVSAQANEHRAESETTTLVAMEGSSVEMEITPAPSVPDMLPEPAAAPVEIELAPIQPAELAPSALPEEYNSVLVDPTNYSVGATEAPSGLLEAAPEIVISEQSTGCEFTVGAGQGVPNGACATGLPAAPAPVAAGQPAQAAPRVQASQSATAGNYYEAAPPVASTPTINVGPVSFSAEGIRFSGATTAAGREYLNRTVRPLVNLQANEQFIFPLAIPSPITSLFGFRTHPISGDQRFHAGTDIGAAQGTPVLAAQDGRVSSAGYAGGYGLMVVLNHGLKETQLESRYAHLSEILVEPDAEVKKGDVIGLVGSTGNSTGPHLHFEMRQLTADGWVLVNPDGLIQYSLANLVKALNNPMQALNFSMADFNLRRVNEAKVSQLGTPSESAVETAIPGLNGIPFRPAQPNAS